MRRSAQQRAIRKPVGKPRPQAMMGVLKDRNATALERYAQMLPIKSKMYPALTTDHAAAPASSAVKVDAARSLNIGHHGRTRRVMAMISLSVSIFSNENLAYRNLCWQLRVSEESHIPDFDKTMMRIKELGMPEGRPVLKYSGARSSVG